MFKIKIANLPRWISEIHLKQFFNNCGKMLEAKVVLDENTLRPLGYGYIIFADEQSLAKALDKNGTMLDGSVIIVDVDTGLENVEASEVAIDLLAEPL